MTSIAVTVTPSSYPWAVESPIPLVEGDQISVIALLAFATNVANDGNLTCLMYKDGAELSSTYLTGSVTATGNDNRINSKTTQALTPGDYVMILTGTLDGLVRRGAKILFQVQALGDVQ